VDGHRFDGLVRVLAAGGSRRTFLTRFAGGATGALLAPHGFSPVAAAPTAPQASQGAVCRKAGESCGGDQLCCAGLPCQAGKDGATRCVDPNPPTKEPTATCPQIKGITVAKLAAYRIEVSCAYDDGADRTTCTCTPRAASGASPVKRLTLAPSDVCAEVVAGDFEVSASVSDQRRATGDKTGTKDNSDNGGQASAGNGGEANAEANGGNVAVQGGDNVAVDASGGAASADASGGDNNVAIVGGGGHDRDRGLASRVGKAVLTLTLAGNVEATGSATYWCETDAGLFPALGPALARVNDDISKDAGAIVLRAADCDVNRAQQGFDWYGECRRPAKLRVRLSGQDGDCYKEQGRYEAGADGRRTVGKLAPGPYLITPDGDTWCHAECDDVDDKGNVVVKANQRTTVWLFNCGKAK
jgi:hypothetical protein